MWFLLAVGSALIFGAAGLFMKASQARGGSVTHLLFGLYLTGTLGFLIHSLWSPPTDWLNWPLLIAGILVGIGSAWGNLIWMKALDFGPAGLTSLLTNMNIVIVIFIAMWWYGESLSLLQTCGILFLLGAIACITVRPNESFTVREKSWFFLIALAIVLFTFRNGGLKVTTEAALSNAAVLLIAYLLSLLLFAVKIVQHNSTDETRNSTKIGLTWGMLAGLCSYGGLQLYAIALEEGPANIVAPIFATNSLVIAIGAVVFFHERLTKLQTIAVLLLLTGLILVRM